MNGFKYLVLALLILPSLYLLAFGPSSTPDTSTHRVIVDYWSLWTGDEEAGMRAIVDDFNHTQGARQNIFVRYVSTSAVTQKVLVATAGGMPPDIAGLDDKTLVQFASLNALQPLEAMATAHGIGPTTYIPVLWNACHYDGHLYALISTPGVVALHYNTDAFRSVGLDHPPQTLAEFDRDAQMLDTRDANGRLTQTGFLPTEPGWYASFSYIWFGANIWDEQHHKLTLTDPGVIDSFKWIQSYCKRLGKDSVNEFRGGAGTFDSPQNPFLAGTMAMVQQGPWMANYILTLKPAMDGLTESNRDDINAPLTDRRKRMHWAAAPFPSAIPGLQNVTYCAFDTMCIPTGAKHPREAFEFIAYVNQQAVMERLCKSHCKSSPLQIVSDDFMQHHKNPYIDVFQNLSKSTNAKTVAQIPIFPELETELKVLVEKLALLNTEPQPALQELQTRMQKRYDAFMEKQLARSHP